MMSNNFDEDVPADFEQDGADLGSWPAPVNHNNVPSAPAVPAVISGNRMIVPFRAATRSVGGERRDDDGESSMPNLQARLMHNRRQVLRNNRYRSNTLSSRPNTSGDAGRDYISTDNASRRRIIEAARRPAGSDNMPQYVVEALQEQELVVARNSNASRSCPFFIFTSPELVGFWKGNWADYRSLIELIAGELTNGSKQALSAAEKHCVLAVFYELLLEMRRTPSRRLDLLGLLRFCLQTLTPRNRMSLIENTREYEECDLNTLPRLLQYFRKEARGRRHFSQHKWKMLMMPLMHKATQYNLKEVIFMLRDVFHADIDKVGLYVLEQDGNACADEPRRPLKIPPGSTADDEKHYVTPLWIAAIYNHTELIDEFIRLGCNLDSRSDRGSTPLRAACFCNCWQACLKLLTAGANANICSDDGGTALINAVHSAYLVQLLLQHGARVCHADHKGKTALHYAAQINCVDSFRELVEKGRASLRARTLFGDTVLRTAGLYNAYNVLQYIQNSSACSYAFSPREVCEAYELLGAAISFKIRPGGASAGVPTGTGAGDNVPTSSTEPWRIMAYWSVALKLRLDNDLYKTPEDVAPPKRHYKYMREFCTQADVDAFHYDARYVRLQSLIVMERILGQRHDFFQRMLCSEVQTLLTSRDPAGIYLALHAIKCVATHKGVFSEECSDVFMQLLQYYLMRIVVSNEDVWMNDDASDGIDDLIRLFGPLLHGMLEKTKAKWARSQASVFLSGKSKERQAEESGLVSFLSSFILAMQLYIRKTEMIEFHRTGQTSTIDPRNLADPIRFTPYMQARLNYLVNECCIDRVVSVVHSMPCIAGYYMENTLIQYDINMSLRVQPSSANAILFALLLSLRPPVESQMNAVYSAAVTMHTAAKAVDELGDSRYLRLMLAINTHADGINSHGETPLDVISRVSEGKTLEETRDLRCSLRHASVRLECLSARALGKMLAHAQERYARDDRREFSHQFTDYMKRLVPSASHRTVLLRKILLHSASRTLFSSAVSTVLLASSSVASSSTTTATEVDAEEAGEARLRASQHSRAQIMHSAPEAGTVVGGPPNYDNSRAAALGESQMVLYDWDDVNRQRPPPPPPQANRQLMNF